jgi:citrate lyase subunit beta/citryl-CoA lyase
VHPSQVAIINEEYGEAPEAVARAGRMVAAFDEAIARGVGAVSFEGQMIDEPVVARARQVLARARR